MKTNILITILLLMSIPMLAQTGYRYNSDFIELKANKSGLFIQTNKQNSHVRNSELETYLGRGKSSSFARISDNRFVIFTENYKPNGEDYVSNIYNINGEGHIIVLPRIVLAFTANDVLANLSNEI